MLIRKNTKAFKTILEIVTVCHSRPDREKFIRLYITKAGHSIQDRISVEGIQGEASFFYEMNYETVLSNLTSSNHQLHVSDEEPGIYFFHSSSNKQWDEAPFEFDESVKKEFSALPELPAFRKREKVQKFVLPTPASKAESASPSVKKEKAKSAKVVKPAHKEPKQPQYGLKHNIIFTDLERIIFRDARVSKQNILDYYNNIADYILPFLKDRALWARLHSDTVRKAVEMSLEDLFKNANEPLPEWIQTTTVTFGKEKKKMLLCNDKNHLMFYVERGCIEFNPFHSKVKSQNYPDYILITIDASEAEHSKAMGVALSAKAILTGLQLPSFVKTNGLSELHLYIPLDSKSDFEISNSVAEYICKLVKLKTPGLITLKGVDEHTYGKVFLDYSLNEPAKYVVAPYSLIVGQSATVATPLLWDELEEDPRVEFDHETIVKRIKKERDPFENFFKKKVNADDLRSRLENHYAFLF